MLVDCFGYSSYHFCVWFRSRIESRSKNRLIGTFQSSHFSNELAFVIMVVLVMHDLQHKFIERYNGTASCMAPRIEKARLIRLESVPHGIQQEPEITATGGEMSVQQVIGKHRNVKSFLQTRV